MNIIDHIFDTFTRNGDALYDGGEAVTQSQHALQAATFAEQESKSLTLVAAALLHDYGHVADESEDNIDRPVDGKHELVGHQLLKDHFIDAVTEPGRLHVAAKRYLCAIEPDYFGQLSPVSVRSLELQGGPFSEEQAAAFRSNPHCQGAVQVRRYDERAKDPTMSTPGFEHFRPCLEAGLRT
jgi:phosphonate degradation associated HDIG domain protein